MSLQENKILRSIKTYAPNHIAYNPFQENKTIQIIMTFLVINNNKYNHHVIIITTILKEIYAFIYP